MSRPIVLTEEAREDIKDARSWYRSRSQVLGRDFARSLRLCLDGIEQFPEQSRVVHRNIRRALLQRFPYMVLYVYVVQQVEEGLRAALDGRVIPHEQVMRELRRKYVSPR